MGKGTGLRQFVLTSTTTVVCALFAGCPQNAGSGDPEPDPDPVEVTSFSFQPLTLDGIAPRWGAPVAPGFVSGGVNADMDVQNDVFALEPVEGGLRVTRPAQLDQPRFCACSFYDSTRNQLVVIGGRDDGFRDTNTAVLIDLTTGTSTEIEDGGAADNPVGCQAHYLGGVDRAYVFGGLSSTGGFSAKTWRWDPEARTFTEVETTGPAARYDAATHEENDGTLLLAGGMGAGGVGVVFFSDVWRFDPSSETWSEVPTTTTAPPGRRYPWTALSPDESQLLYGFGSDSARGDTVLGDMWSFDLATGAWSELEVEGALPSARGFAYRWNGPVGTAGVLAFGSDESLNAVDSAFVLQPPDALVGDWH